MVLENNKEFDTVYKRMDVKLPFKESICEREPKKGPSVNCLFPEILTIIFCYLDLRDKGRVAQVSSFQSSFISLVGYPRDS